MVTRVQAQVHEVRMCLFYDTADVPMALFSFISLHAIRVNLSGLLQVQSMSPAPNHSEPEPVVKPVQTPHDGYNGGENAEMYEGGNALPDVFSYGSVSAL